MFGIEAGFNTEHIEVCTVGEGISSDDFNALRKDAEASTRIEVDTSLVIAGTATELCYTPGEEPKLLLYMLDRAAAEESMKSLDAEALELLGMEIGAVMSTAEVDDVLVCSSKEQTLVFGVQRCCAASIEIRRILTLHGF